jgi:hypothetical protein
MTTEERVRHFIDLAAAQRDAEFLTIKQVALLLGKADSTVREMVREDWTKSIATSVIFRPRDRLKRRAARLSMLSLDSVRRRTFSFLECRRLALTPPLTHKGGQRCFATRSFH